MQVLETSNSQNLGSPTDSFIRKSENIMKIGNGKKVEMLNIYCKATKNGANYWSITSPTIQINMYSLQLNLL